MATIWRIQLFSGLQIEREEHVIAHFETRKAASLLAYLLFYLHRSHSREVLAELLWPDEDPEVLRGRFRQTLATIRRLLEPAGVAPDSVLRADRVQVSLQPDAIFTDVGAFEAELNAANRASDRSRRLAHLLSAVQCYQGELLPGFYDDWAGVERMRLADLYRTALLRTAGELERDGQSGRAIEVARQAVIADALQEDGHTELISLYVRAGRQADAQRQYQEMERILKEELGGKPTHSAQDLFAQARESLAVVRLAAGEMAPPVEEAPRTLSGDAFASAAVGHEARDTGQQITETSMDVPDAIPLETEGGAVLLDSPFYLERPVDAAFTSALTRGDSIVLVKGARQIGKTSLLARGLQCARSAGTRVALIDLQKLTSAQLGSADDLFYTFAEILIDALDIDVALEQYWDRQRGWNVNFERFLRRGVLARLEGPLIFALDEVDRLLGYPYSVDMFSLFRSWHNARSLDPSGPWSKLTLAMAYATEAHLFITDLNKSPFNVGTRLTLTDFTPDEVAEMIRRYGAPLRTEEERLRLYTLVGGAPYLVRLALHALTSGSLTLMELESQADSDDGLFSESLRRMLTAIRQDKDLHDAVTALLCGNFGFSTDSFYRLRSAGVVTGDSPEHARFRCRVYSRYLEKHLG